MAIHAHPDDKSFAAGSHVSTQKELEHAPGRAQALFVCLQLLKLRLLRRNTREIAAQALNSRRLRRIDGIDHRVAGRNTIVWT